MSGNLSPVPGYRKVHRFGPAGINCPCCTVYSSGRKNRKQTNRLVRAMLQAHIRREMDRLGVTDPA